jgi:uncharacterized phage-associated protein
MKIMFKLFKKKTKEIPIEPYAAIDVARFIINYAYKNDMFVSSTKLHRILYFVQLTFLQHNRICFKDSIIATSIGPICPAVNKEYKYWGSMQIPPVTEYWDLSEGIWNAKKVKWINNIRIDDQKIIIDILEECSNYSSVELYKITTHQYPNMNCYNKFKKDTTITIDVMKEFLKRIEKKGDE